MKPYAATIDSLWTANAIMFIKASNFKSGIEKVNARYKGFRQHDASEFLITTIDSLHEEMNLRTKKPYIPNPELRPDTLKLSREFWSNYLRRNWSFWVFLMYGQIKSTIECTQCDSKKVSYDPCSVISLPLPAASNLQISIVVNPLPVTLQRILKG